MHADNFVSVILALLQVELLAEDPTAKYNSMSYSRWHFHILSYLPYTLP